jgi:2-polyprenyl-3-methyl-5-hydroxy-6-metoxy-1,4-benzoquinol methylase
MQFIRFGRKMSGCPSGKDLGNPVSINQSGSPNGAAHRLAREIVAASSGISTTVLCRLCDRAVPMQREYAQRANWSYFRCPSCGLVFLYPAPDDKALQNFYNTSYEVEFQSYFKGVRRRAKITLDELETRFPGHGRLLEVGCSYGGFLAEARSRGWDVTGVELSETAAGHARSLGLRVFSGSLPDQIPNLGDPYDVLVMFHVIEHVPDPLVLLESCRKLIKPHGLLVLKTPNVESSIAKIMGSSWHWISPPAHLYLYSPATLKKLLTKAGYRTVTLNSSQGDAHNNLFAIASGITREMFFQSNTQSMAQVRRSLPVRLVEMACEIAYYPFRILMDPWLAATLRQPELYAVAVNDE